jgi:hypothetical protein
MYIRIYVYTCIHTDTHTYIHTDGSKLPGGSWGRARRAIARGAARGKLLHPCTRFPRGVCVCVCVFVWCVCVCVCVCV